MKEMYPEIEKVTKYSNFYLGKCYTWLSTPITAFAAKRGWHPNTLTLASLLVAAAAVLCLSSGIYPFVIIGAVLLYLSYVLDWCDGQLARYTGKVSPFGGWFDQISDRCKEFLYVLGLALGAYKADPFAGVFIAALLALFFLFLLEYYGQMARAIPDPQAEVSAAIETAQGASFYDVKPPTKRFIIDFGIDEQYAYIVAATIALGEAWTLYGLVVLSCLMAVYKPVKGWTRYLSAKRGDLS
ncbi:CDP-alcohol phosphatidyltransferase family protein [Fodinisporobacter ferrooxydans]|uniref:CDP-alcohol phosphatidyltransferase family protein n=1 Tax=Fodinisporobacter ferrooxydans TaxID=2901836 RepID=A0ABY4CIY3_9BACL|nr:CDP-alcohol phosphatidyltransferase family protein [Alicyclobacillaceae bacterium MYW30-H2]